jgi:Uma2 family endonuclease
LGFGIVLGGFSGTERSFGRLLSLGTREARDVAKTGMTAEELLRLPDDGKRYELVEGKLKEMAPAGGRHGSVVATLTILVGQLREGAAAGRGARGEDGVQDLPEPADGARRTSPSWRESASPRRPPEGYWDLAPNLAAEVVSPNDTAAEIQSKVQMWLDAGTRLVWVL